MLGSVALSLIGCGSGGVREYSVPVSQPGGLDRAKQLLEGYASGEPVGSEVIGFDEIGADAKKQDPKQGEIVERGLQEIGALMNRPAAIKEKAKQILSQLD